MRPRHASLVVAVALGMLAFAGSAPAQTEPDVVLVSLSFSDRPTLVVQQPSASDGDIFVIEGTGSAGPGPSPAKVAIDVPLGYGLDLSPTPGDSVGIGLLSVVEERRQSVSVIQLGGLLATDDPAGYASDPEALACDPRPHHAVWLFEASALGLRLDMPVFVDAPPADVAGAAAELVLCPPVPRLAGGQPTQAGPIRIAVVAFVFEIETARRQGTYLWRAFVTPLGPVGAAPEDTFELRSTVPVPHRLTLRGRYEPKTRTALLRGRILGSGKPRRGVKVRLLLFSGPPRFNLQRLGSARTNASGSFAFRRPLAKTGIFFAFADTSVGRCAGPSTAPAGCVTSTIPSPGSASTTVVVPGKRR
jgi:hypothetical protein